MSQTFSVSTPSPLHLFKCFNCFPILYWACTAPSYVEYVPLYPFNTGTGLHYQSINQLTCSETVIYSDNSPSHKPLHIPNMASSNLCCFLLRTMNHYTYQIWQISNPYRYCTLSVTWTITHTEYDKAVIYAVILATIWTITHNKYGKAVIYAVYFPIPLTITHTKFGKAIILRC